MVERLDYIRYIIIGGSLIAFFMNLIDELNKGSTLIHIFLYSGSLFIICIFMIFVEKLWALISILFLSGMFMLIDDLEPGRISAAVSLLGYSLYLANNKYMNYITYLIVAIIVTSSHVFNGCSPEDVVNVLMGYAVFFALNELVYNKRISDVSVGG